MGININNYIDESALQELEKELMNDPDYNLYSNGVAAIRDFIHHKNHDWIQLRIDIVKYVKGNENRPMHDALDLIEEKYGEREETKEVDKKFHRMIKKVIKDLVKYARTAGFIEPKDKIYRKLVGRPRGERGYEPVDALEKIIIPLRAHFSLDGQHIFDYWEMLANRAQNWFRYRRSVKEIRDMRILIRRKKDSDLIDVIAIYDIERQPGNIVQSLTIGYDVKEKDIEYVIPSHSRKYGSPFKSEDWWKPWAFIVSAVAASYALGEIPQVVDFLSDIPFALDLLKIARVEEKYAEAAVSYGSILVIRHLLKSLLKYGKARNNMRRPIKTYNIDDLIKLSDEVEKQESLKARICYAVVWNSGEVSSLELYKKVKKYGFCEDEVEEHLKYLEGIKVIKNTRRGYKPFKKRLPFTPHEIKEVDIRDRKLENQMDEIIRRYPV